MATQTRPKPPIVENELRIPNVLVVGPRLLVQPHEPTSQTKGGIFIPAQAQDRQQRGIVLAVGDGIITERGDHIPCPVEVGQHIIYARFGGAQIEIPDEYERKQQYLIIMQSDIYCVLYPELKGQLIEDEEELEEAGETAH